MADRSGQPEQRSRAVLAARGKEEGQRCTQRGIASPDCSLMCSALWKDDKLKKEVGKDDEWVEGTLTLGPFSSTSGRIHWKATDQRAIAHRSIEYSEVSAVILKSKAGAGGPSSSADKCSIVEVSLDDGRSVEIRPTRIASEGNAERKGHDATKQVFEFIQKRLDECETAYSEGRGSATLPPFAWQEATAGRSRMEMAPDEVSPIQAGLEALRGVGSSQGESIESKQDKEGTTEKKTVNDDGDDGVVVLEEGAKIDAEWFTSAEDASQLSELGCARLAHLESVFKSPS